MIKQLCCNNLIVCFGILLLVAACHKRTPEVKIRLHQDNSIDEKEFTEIRLNMLEYLNNREAYQRILLKPYYFNSIPLTTEFYQDSVRLLY